MDIKVLKNFEVKRAEFVNKNLLSAVCDNALRKQASFICQEMFLINPDTNEKVPVSPEHDKCLTENIIYASSDRDYIVFSTLSSDTEESGIITWYIYKCFEGDVRQLHSLGVDFNRLESELFIKCFVLDEFHMLIQRQEITSGEHTFSFIMYNSQDGTVSEVTIPRLVETGIDCMFPLAGGRCALKFGRSFSSDKPFAYKTPEHNNERIGVVPVNKLISELSIDMDNRFVEIIEESNELTTLPYMKVSGKLIIYAVYYPSEEKEDIILYDTESGKKTVRINSRLSSINDLWHTFVIGDNPYLISGTGVGVARITDLNTQKVVAKLNSGDDIPAVCGNYVVLKGKRKKFLKETDFVEVYEFSKLLKEPVLSLKAVFEHCIVFEDTMILFVNDSRMEDER